MISAVAPLLLFLSDCSPTAPLSVDTPGSVIVDRQPTSGHLTGSQGGRVGGQHSQSGGIGVDLLQRSVAELIHPQEVSLGTGSELIVVSLNMKYRYLYYIYVM